MRHWLRPKYAWLPFLIITMTLVALAIGVMAFRSIEDRQIALTGKGLTLTAVAIADQLDLFLYERIGHIQNAAKAPAFQRQDRTASDEYLKAVQTASHHFYLWLGMTDADGRIVASTNPAILGQDRKTSTWFQAVRNTGTLHLGDVEPFEEAGGMEAISLTAPIAGPRGEFLGVVTARVGLPPLEEILTYTVRSAQAQQRLSDPIEYQFLTQAGYAFIDSDLAHKGNVNLKRLGLRSALLTESGRPGYIEEEHLRRHVPVVTGYAKTQSHRDVPDLRWGILLHVDLSDVLAPTRTALQSLAIVGAIVCIPMFVMLLWTTGRLRKEWEQEQEESARARTAESALRESETRLKTVMRATNDLTWEWDLKTNALWLSDNVLGLFGYQPHELKDAESWFSRLHPDDKDRMTSDLYAVIQRGHPFWSGEYRFCRADGSYAYVYDRGFIRFDESGAPVRMTGAVMDITERKRAEEALHRSQEQLQAIWQNSSAIIFIKDLQGRYLDINPQFSTLTRLSRERILGKTDADIFPSEQAASFRANDLKVLEADHPLEFEEIAEHEDGPRTSIVYKFPLHDSQGCLFAIGGIVTDITERKRAERALLQSEERFRSAFGHAAIGMALVSIDGRWLQVNQALCDIVGYSVQELLAQTFQAITHPDDLETDLNYVRRILAGEIRYYQMEKRYLHKLGHAVWILLGVSLVRDGEGNPLHFISLITDITERKRAEEALAASEKRLRTILEAEPECVQVTTEDGVLLDMNTAGLAMFEADSLDQIRGLSILQFIAPDYRDAYATLTSRAYQGETGTLQFVITGLKGRRLWLEAHAVPLRDEHNVAIGVLAISRDITERKRAEDALRSSERVLRTVLKEREQLVQDLHDGIIQSLYAIGMSIEECRRLVEEDPEKARLKLGQEVSDVNAVIRAVRSHLVQGEDDLPFSASRFKAELTRVAGTMERANALHFRLKVDQRAAERLTSEERREILYIAQETMSNCLRHSGAAIANISLRLARDHVHLEVEDDGMGFDKQTLHETNGGLRNIERRAAKIGAKMEIESHREHGTRIRLDMPIHR